MSRPSHGKSERSRARPSVESAREQRVTAAQRRSPSPDDLPVEGAAAARMVSPDQPQPHGTSAQRMRAQNLMSWFNLPLAEQAKQWSLNEGHEAAAAQQRQTGKARSRNPRRGQDTQPAARPNVPTKTSAAKKRVRRRAKSAGSAAVNQFPPWAPRNDALANVVANAEQQVSQPIQKQAPQPVQQPPVPYNRNKSFTVLGKLGSGSFSTVLRVRKNGGYDDGVIYAAKITRKERIRIRENLRESTWMENRLLKDNNNNPFIPVLYYAFRTNNNLNLVMEYCPGVDLYLYMKLTAQTVQQDLLTDEQVIRIAGEVAMGIQLLHEIGILHQDIKPQNATITRSGHIKLIDFGLADSVNSGKKLSCGTVTYTAPEVLERKGHSAASDWWSYGMLLSALIFSKNRVSSLPISMFAMHGFGSPQDNLKNRYRQHIKTAIATYFSQVTKDFPAIPQNHREIWECLFPPNGLYRFLSLLLGLLYPDPMTRWRWLPNTAIPHGFCISTAAIFRGVVDFQQLRQGNLGEPVVPMHLFAADGIVGQAIQQHRQTQNISSPLDEMKALFDDPRNGSGNFNDSFQGYSYEKDKKSPQK